MAMEVRTLLGAVLKSLTLLWQEVASELATWCCTSTSLDFKTVETRVKHEGESFLTITLPSFCNDFQKSLAQGSVDRNQYQGFTFTGSLPRFLGGFFDLVFDRGTGLLLDSPSVDAIYSIRQLTLMFGKILLPCSDVRKDAAIEGYFECEKAVKEADARRRSQEIDDFHRMSRLLWANLFATVDNTVAKYEIIPKHGPGATADRLKGNQKFNQTEWTQRLEEVFPSDKFLLPNWNYFSNLNRIDWLEPGRERPVRVVLVPKTLKTPRIIAIEPTAMQYAQQGLLESFEKAIEADDNAKSFISWSSNVPNQELARLGSQFGELATLDLSEASDRVSNQLVLKMLQNHPHLSDAVQASRSRKAEVLRKDKKEIIRLAKFASMGSALCFPFESFVFMTVIFLGIERELRRPLTLNDIKSFKGQVRTYGDDIIVPVRYVRSVVSELETFGFKVNTGKSFWTGYFRESCGKDYYKGEDVSVVRVRRVFPTPQSSVPRKVVLNQNREGFNRIVMREASHENDSERNQQIISMVSLRNQLYKRGLWKTTRYLDNLVERIIPFPAVAETSSILGKHNFTGYESVKEHPSLQVPIVKGMKVVNVAPSDKLDDVGALLKFFLKRSEEPFIDRRHLERYGRPEAVNIKLRWAPAY